MIFLKSRFTQFAVSMTAVLFVSLAHADLLQLEPGNQTNNGVNISKGASVKLEQQNVNLTTVGSGLRTKKVLVSKVKVYVAQLFVSEPQNFIKKADQALKSLDQVKTVAMRLSFLRTVEAEKVQVSFRDSLVGNQVNINSAEIAQFLKAVTQGGDANENTSLTILLNKNADGTESLFYEDSQKHLTEVKGPKGLTQQVMSIWFGQPADDGVVDLRNQLLK